MGELTNFPKTLWALHATAQCVLLIFLVVRKSYRDYPAFTFYISINLLKNAAVFLVSNILDVSPMNVWRISWGLQGVVICVRALALAEVCRHILGRFRGIWGLARGILLGCAVLVLFYSLLLAQHQWSLAVLNADRGLEMAFAAVIVTLFLFVRYYELVVESTPRWVAIGFFSYSCFYVLNITILERWLDNYLMLWNVLGTLTFIAVVFLWSWTFRSYERAERPAQELLPSSVYGTLSPEINLRLRLLNDRLSDFWNTEARQP